MGVSGLNINKGSDMPYKEVRGNLFISKAQALVNTINCVGVMVHSSA